MFHRADLVNCDGINVTTWSQSTTDIPMDDSHDPFASLRDYFQDFLRVAETYTMTSFACLGLILNAFAIAFLTRDSRMWPMSRCLHVAFLVAEELFLAVTVAFIQFRKFVHQPGTLEVDYYEVCHLFRIFLIHKLITSRKSCQKTRSLEVIA